MRYYIILLCIVIFTSGCFDPYYDEYITDAKYTTTGTYKISDLAVTSSDKPTPDKSEIIIDDASIVVINFPVYNFNGKIIKYVDGAFPKITTSNGSMSDGKTIYGFQDGKSEVVFNYLTNDRISIGIGDPDSGERIVFSKVKYSPNQSLHQSP